MIDFLKIFLGLPTWSIIGVVVGLFIATVSFFVGFSQTSTNQSVQEIPRGINNLSRDNIEIWIWHYPPSPQSDDGEYYLKNYSNAKALKDNLLALGFRSINLSSTPKPENRTEIRYVNFDDKAILAEVYGIVSKLSNKLPSPIFINKPSSTVGFTHPSIDIDLALDKDLVQPIIPSGAPLELGVRQLNDSSHSSQENLKGININDNH